MFYNSIPFQGFLFLQLSTENTAWHRKPDCVPTVTDKYQQLSLGCIVLGYIQAAFVLGFKFEILQSKF